MAQNDQRLVKEEIMVLRRRKRRSMRRSRRRARWLKICAVAAVSVLLAGTLAVRSRSPLVSITAEAETAVEDFFAARSNGTFPRAEHEDVRPLGAYPGEVDRALQILRGESAPALLAAGRQVGGETAPAPVPEPLSLLLVGTGVLGILGFRTRRS